MLSQNFSGPILSVLADLGQRVLAVPTGWHPHDGIPFDKFPDAVVFDWECRRHAYYLAGYYRGAGVAVVHVTGAENRGTRRFASRTGCMALVGAAAFREWLSTDPPYLYRG